MSAKPASAHDALAVAKAWVDAANAKDLEAAGRIVAPDFNFSMLPASLNGPTNVVGRDNFTKGFGAVLGLLVNPKWTIVNSNASEGKAWLSCKVQAHFEDGEEYLQDVVYMIDVHVGQDGVPLVSSMVEFIDAIAAPKLFGRLHATGVAGAQ